MNKIIRFILLILNQSDSLKIDVKLEYVSSSYLLIVNRETHTHNISQNKRIQPGKKLPPLKKKINTSFSPAISHIFAF